MLDTKAWEPSPPAMPITSAPAYVVRADLENAESLEEAPGTA
jgi:hypothetical protein